MAAAAPAAPPPGFAGPEPRAARRRRRFARSSSLRRRRPHRSASPDASNRGQQPLSACLIRQLINPPQPRRRQPVGGVDARRHDQPAEGGAWRHRTYNSVTRGSRRGAGGGLAVQGAAWARGCSTGVLCCVVGILCVVLLLGRARVVWARISVAWVVWCVALARGLRGGRGWCGVGLRGVDID